MFDFLPDDENFVSSYWPRWTGWIALLAFLAGPVALMVLLDLDSAVALPLGWMPTAVLVLVFDPMPSERDPATRRLRRRSASDWERARKRGLIAMGALILIAIVIDWASIRVGG